MEKSPRASPLARQLAGRVQKCNPFHPCGPARPGPYKSGQNRAGSKRAGLARFDIPTSDTAPDTFLTNSATLLDSLLCAIPAFLLHPRRRWPPRNTKAECSSPLTASRFSSTVTFTTSLAAARKRSAVHGERRATIGLRFADDSDRHDHREDRFVRNLRSGSLLLDL